MWYTPTYRAGNLEHSEQQLLRFCRDPWPDYVVPFGMELIAGDVEAFHCGFADLDALLVAARRFGRPRKPFYIVLSKDDIDQTW